MFVLSGSMMCGLICLELTSVLDEDQFFHLFFLHCTYRRSGSYVTGHVTCLLSCTRIIQAPSVSELDNLFKICERGLKLLDMAINVRKSSCIRIGHRMDAQCANISLSTGSVIPETR